MPHSIFMQQAYALALKGWGAVSPNPMVGCVIVEGNQIVASGYHSRYGQAHAEVEALKQWKSKNRRQARMYVTLEPCAHWGKQPPCVEAILASGIRQVIIGANDPNPLCSGQSIRLMKKAGIEVISGVMSDELTKLNAAFNHYITQKKPWVVAKSAMTLDGFIADLHGQSKWITASQSRDLTHALRWGFDAIAVGVGTVLADDPYLHLDHAPNMYQHLKGKDSALFPYLNNQRIKELFALRKKGYKVFKKVILDTHLRTPLTARLFKNTLPQDILIYTAKSKGKHVEAMSRQAQVIKAPVHGDGIDLAWVLNDLGRQGCAALLLEGGGRVIGQALAQALINEMWIIMAPKLLGRGLNAFHGLKTASLEKPIMVSNMQIECMNEDIMLRINPSY